MSVNHAKNNSAARGSARDQVLTGNPGLNGNDETKSAAAGLCMGIRQPAWVKRHMTSRFRELNIATRMKCIRDDSETIAGRIKEHAPILRWRRSGGKSDASVDKPFPHSRAIAEKRWVRTFLLNHLAQNNDPRRESPNRLSLQVVRVVVRRHPEL
jgi:hypothetical protein